MNRGFGSDNHAPVHPDILQSIIAANVGHEPSYGTDSLSEQCSQLFKKQFGQNAEVYFVFNGTAANVLSLQILMQKFESCLVTDTSHLNTDECGAPEAHAGKLISVNSTNGKFNINSLKQKIIRIGDQHFSQPKAISITQPTEVGTTYSIQELKEIISWAKSQNFYVHIDGARLANAAYTLNCTLRELTTDLGADIISMGGTKNGFLFGEAVIILNSDLQKNIKFLRKQLCQLPSKTRFIACQFKEYLTNDNYKKIAKLSCDSAQYLAEQLNKKCKDVTILEPVQSNAVFISLPKTWVKNLKKEKFFYVWNENPNGTHFDCRLMTSWDTQKEDIDTFIAAVLALK